MENIYIDRKHDTSGNHPRDNGRGNNGGTAEEKEPKKQGLRNAQKIDNPLPPRLLSLKAAAVYMGRTTWGMRELYWANKIPWIRDGKKIYFDVRDLDSYIERVKTTYV
jgi:hypothetical protein